MTGRDDTYLRIYDGRKRRLEYNKFAPRELYTISLVSRRAYNLCRAKLDKWRRLYNKYLRYFAESFHNRATQSFRFNNRQIIVSRYIDMYVPIHHDLLGPCLIDHHTFKDGETDYLVGLYGLTLWFTRPGSFELSIAIEGTQEFNLVYQEIYNADDFIFENGIWVVNCFSWRSNPITIFMQNLSRICMTVSNTANEMPTRVVTEFGYDRIFEEYETSDIFQAAGCVTHRVNQVVVQGATVTPPITLDHPDTSDPVLTYKFNKFVTPIGSILSSSLSPKFILHIKNEGVSAYTPRLAFSGTFMTKPPDYYKWYLINKGYRWCPMEELFMGDNVVISKIVEDITATAILLANALQHE